MATESKLRENVIAFTDRRKDLFSSNLAQQLENMSSKLDEQQRYRLQSISVADIVSDVTNKVVKNVVEEGQAFNRAVDLPLHLLTREVATMLVGKPITVEEASKNIGDRLSDVAAATYSSEIAKTMLNAITQLQPTAGVQQTVPDAIDAVDCKLLELVSTAALAASPMGALYDSAGTRFRAAITMEDAGMIIMGGAPFTGPDAPLVFLFGAGVYLIGRHFRREQDPPQGNI